MVVKFVTWITDHLGGLGGRESVKGLILLNIENIEKIEIDGAITEHR